MHEGYRILEHPSDIGIEANGQTLKDALEYVARGLVSIIVDPSTVEPIEQRYIRLAANDLEQLLVKWLSEILYLYDGNDFLVSDVSIEQLSNNSLEAILTGDILDERKHVLKLDVKAITYHQLEIEEREDGCRVKVFVDI